MIFALRPDADGLAIMEPLSHTGGPVFGSNLTTGDTS
jgi:hypothetical protein